MTEKIISGKKNGLSVMLLLLLAYLAAILLTVFGGIMMDAGKALGVVLFVIGIVYVSIGWLTFLGLKVLKPQEALVLTLFGKYIGTLKGEGFYYVNPFCTPVNPAARTKLNQSGDVDAGHSVLPKVVINTPEGQQEVASRSEEHTSELQSRI